MTFVIITHVPHVLVQNQYFAYAPYVREMNIWTKYADKVIIVSPKTNDKITALDFKYEHQNIEFIAIDSFDVLRFNTTFLTIFKLPKISWQIYNAMKKANHIHLRCPGNVGLLGSVVQIMFPKKIKTAKYAGNWDPKSKQPLTYKIQKWILSNTFLTRNMQTLIYGKWDRMSGNLKPFFTATYKEEDIITVTHKNLNGRIDFIFVGALVKGKNPLYALQLVEELSKKGNNVHLTFYGEGDERTLLEYYIEKNNLHKIISLEGNQTQEIVKNGYQRSHFVLLPSQSEGWPKAIAEGMFWGCIPIATGVSCLPYMLDYGKRGVLLTLDCENDVNLILSYISNRNKYSSIAISAQKWSQRYTLNLFEQEIIKLML
jgi:glycosyltransferase involved in cell wall biosynthesis